MTIPRVRVYLPPPELEPILGAVNITLNGLVGVSLGYFPNRHPLDRIDFIASDVHGNREYSPEMALQVLSLRNRLRTISSNRMRLDLIDITFCIFAVGVAKRAKTIEPRPARALKLKLEKLRKRALRVLTKCRGIGRVPNGRGTLLPLRSLVSLQCLVFSSTTAQPSFGAQVNPARPIRCLAGSGSRGCCRAFARDRLE